MYCAMSYKTERNNSLNFAYLMFCRIILNIIIKKKK